jgi:Family of unknown function (DUF6325)
MEASEAHGPIDFVLLEYPADAGLAATSAALLDLVDRGTVRVYDVAIVRKDDEGGVSMLEFSDFGDGEAAMVELSGARSGMLSEDDVAMSADAMEAGTVAMLIVFENTWAVPFVAAALSEGGTMVASERIPAEDVIAVLDALDAED